MESLVVGICASVILNVLLMYQGQRKDKQIERQQGTINRLIEHEPVTYKETGIKPEKPVMEAYAAWGNETYSRDE